MDRLTLVFMRRNGNRLIREDTYESEAMGGIAKGLPESFVDADGSLVIGIIGKTRDNGNVCQLGLVTLDLD
jgi:hypothetical protein